MTKISNQRAYIPDEEINGLDYLPGTDFDQALKTVNFRVQDLGTHYNQVNGVRNFDYNFYAHSGSNPKPADGYFYSNSNEQDPNNITYFVFSKKTARFKDTTNFFESISTENPFDLIIAQKVDINTIFFFRIDSIETFSGYYKLNVSEVFFPNGKELSYTLSYTVFNLKNEALGPIPTKTSDLTNDGSDGTSTYVETDELGATAFSNDYNDLDNLPTIPTVITNHSGLNLDDGTNPHGTTKTDVGLGNVPNVDTSITSNISEGSNLYFTTARVLATILSGLSLATGGAIVSTDSILVAFGKIQKQIDDLTTSIGNKLDKDITAGVERAYIVNADGSQGTKATSDFKDVLEFADFDAFPTIGETGKIYLALDTNKTYRWSGSVYVQIGGTAKKTENLFFQDAVGSTVRTITADQKNMHQSRFLANASPYGVLGLTFGNGIAETGGVINLSHFSDIITPQITGDYVGKVKKIVFSYARNVNESSANTNLMIRVMADTKYMTDMQLIAEHNLVSTTTLAHAEHKVEIPVLTHLPLSAFSNIGWCIRSNNATAQQFGRIKINVIVEEI